MRTRASWAVIPLIFLAGCTSSTTSGEPVPVSDSDSNGSSTTHPDTTLPYGGAPKVPDPLDAGTLARVEKDPCGALTASQLDQLGLGPHGDGKRGDTGPICFWRNGSTGSLASVNYPTDVVNKGLSQLYDGHLQTYKNGYFYPIQSVDGFPGVASDSNDQRRFGTCSVQIGLTDKDIVSVGVNLSRDKQGTVDPCGPARNVAAMVLATVRKDQ